MVLSIPSDSLVIANQIELLGGPNGVASVNPLCPGAVYRLMPGYDLSTPQPTTDYVGSLILDGERPFGRRASNRQITLTVKITAPTFTILAAAREILFDAVDEQSWPLIWTRATGTDPSSYPLVLECFRAHPSIVKWGGADTFNLRPVGLVTLSFDALPYGRSDEQLQLALASPLIGGTTPTAPVTLDGFSSVSGSNWVSSSQHVVGPASARFDPGIAPLSNDKGGTVPATYTAAISGAPVNLAGLTGISVWAGF